MRKLTIVAVITFSLALFGFLAYDSIEGAIQDTAMDMTGEAVKQAQIDSGIKESIISAFDLLKIVGIVGTIGGIAVLWKKYF